MPVKEGLSREWEKMGKGKSILLPRHLYRIPAEGVAQIRSGSFPFQRSGFKTILPTSNNLTKHNPSQVYPIAWALVNSRCRRLTIKNNSHRNISITFDQISRYHRRAQRVYKVNHHSGLNFPCKRWSYTRVPHFISLCSWLWQVGRSCGPNRSIYL